MLSVGSSFDNFSRTLEIFAVIMSLDCNKLVTNSQIIKTNDIKTIPLDEDFVTLFDAPSWDNQSYIIGLLFVLLFILLISSFLLWLLRSTSRIKQRAIKLRIHSMYLSEEINDPLDPYTNHNQDINSIILAFSDIKIIDPSRITPNNHDLFHLFIIYILIGTLLIASYTTTFMVVSHWNDSYVSYLKVECNFLSYDFFTRAIAVLDIDELCEGERYPNIQFQVNLLYDYAADTTYFGNDCYINKHDFTVRAPVIPCESLCCCCGSSDTVSRCGKGIKCASFNLNCGGYFWCFSAGLCGVICWIRLVIKYWQQLDRKYDNVSVSRLNNECLLSVKTQ